jgi:cell wall-associated NlpC family hydrolase
MKNLLCTGLVSAWLTAVPGWTWADELGQFLSEKGLLSAKTGPGVSLKASELVVHAMGFLGVPYKWGGNEAETGLDCSGFVRAVYQQVTGVVLPRTSDRQAAATQNIEPGDLAPGDLVFFNTMQQSFSHVGIYIGNGKFVHSPRAGDRIKLDHLSSSYWKPRFDGARRVAYPGALGVARPTVAATAIE